MPPFRFVQALAPGTRRLGVVLVGLLCLGVSPAPGQAGEARYHVVKIIEGNGTTIPEAGGINQKGQVVGSIDMFGHPKFWLWNDGVRQDLPFGGGFSGWAAAVNDHGHVVGTFQTGDYYFDGWGDLHWVRHACVWKEGAMLGLGTLGGWDSFGTWINDQGIILGLGDTATSTDRIPLMVRDGQMHSLHSLIANPAGWKLSLEASYVAADGRIWGLGTYNRESHIYEMTPQTNGMYQIRSRGIIETIDIVKVFAINELGQVAGRTRLSALEGPAFRWDEQGMQFLGDGRQGSGFPYAINNLGQVVGMTTFEPPSYNAFLWENGAVFNLNTLIPPDSGIVLIKAGANGINDAGEIVCTYRDLASGLYGVCVLVPVDPVPLQITGHAMTPNGLVLEVRGGAGESLVIEYTSDWAQWTTLAMSTNLFGRRTFLDPDGAGTAFRAYRARLVVP